MKKFLKALKIFGIIIVCTIGFIYYMAFGYKEHLMSSKSPNKNYEITVKYISPFFFGNHEMYVYYKQKNCLIKHKLFQTGLRNDGANLGNWNCLIEWKSENELTITLIGEEQPDEKFIIVIDKDKKTIQITNEDIKKVKKLK